MATPDSTDAVTDAERFAEYRANPTVEKRNELAEFFLQDCLNLSKHICGRYRCHSNTRDEFLSESQIMLLKCVERYDPEKHEKFVGFLYFCLARRLRRIMKVSKDREPFAAVGTVDQELSYETEDYRTPEQTEESELIKRAEQFLGKTLVQARFIDGKTLEETGELLGVSRSTVLLRIGMFARKYKRESNVA